MTKQEEERVARMEYVIESLRRERRELRKMIELLHRKLSLQKK